MTFCYHQALKCQGQIKKRNKIFYKYRHLIKKLKWKQSSIITTNTNDNTSLQCFICMGGNLWLDLCLLIKGFFVNFSKFGCRFLGAQKWLPISKTPCMLLFNFHLSIFDYLCFCIFLHCINGGTLLLCSCYCLLRQWFDKTFSVFLFIFDFVTYEPNDLWENLVKV